MDRDLYHTSLLVGRLPLIGDDPVKLRSPIRLNNKLSRFSVIALVGLVAFAAFVLVANPFAGQKNSAGAAANTVPSSPTTGAPSGGTGGQGSLLTTPPGTGSGSMGTHHHEHDDGNSTGRDD